MLIVRDSGPSCDTLARAFDTSKRPDRYILAVSVPVWLRLAAHSVKWPLEMPLAPCERRPWSLLLIGKYGGKNPGAD